MSQQTSTETLDPSEPINLFQIQQSYQFYVHIIVPVVVIYCGVFVMLSNHYILRPRAQNIFAKINITSPMIQQIIIDFMSNLSSLSFLMSSILMTNTDNGFSMVAIGDCLWTGLLISIVSYRNIQQNQEEMPESKILLKNALILCLCYGTVVYHYFAQIFFISLGSALLGIYVISLILVGYEEKFCKLIDELLQLQQEVVMNDDYKHQNNMTSLEVLSKNYPCKRWQILQKIQPFKTRLQKIKESNKKTRMLASSRLLYIALAVHISRNKMESDMKTTVKQYYGSINGTIQKKNNNKTHNSKFYNIVNTRAFQPNQINIQLNNANAFEIPERQQIEGSQQQQQTSILFYIFPIRMFEASKVLSVVMSVFINLGLGFLIDFAINVGQTLEYGRYFQFLYAIILLPLLPNTSRFNYFSSMCLSSVSKFGIIGLFLLIWSISYGINITFKVQSMLQYCYIAVILLVLINMLILGFKGRVEKVILPVWVICFLCMAVVFFFMTKITPSPLVV